MEFQKNILLKNYTTFKIGGPAEYFFTAKNKIELIKAIHEAKILNLPFFILAAGSNVLFSDKGYDGLVIKFENPKLSQLVNKGLEWAAGIPGTVAGAIYGNAGAFGKSMADVVKTVEVFDVKSNKIKKLKNRQCKFGYRNSIFKENSNLIILSAEIRLKKSNSKKIKKYLEYRKKTQPLSFPSAGSIFKNFTPHRNKISGAGPAFKTLIKKFKKKDVIPAAYLIEKCGLKGKKIGGAKISELHSNFIVNLGGASAKDVLKLIDLAKRKVKNKFGVELKEEIRKIY